MDRCYFGEGENDKMILCGRIIFPYVLFVDQACPGFIS